MVIRIVSNLNKKRICLLIIALAAAIHATKWNELEGYTFNHYRHEFQKKYSQDELSFREEIFNKKMIEVRRHNSDNTKTWKLGVNQFTDRTTEEFEKLLGLDKKLLYKTKYEHELKEGVSVERSIDIASLPSNVDWRQKNIITAVKDQGQCGSCWTFGSTETVESYWALKSGELSDLSEQQVLDCTDNVHQCGGTGGCEGGTAELAYTQINAMGGQASEWTWPYISYSGNDFKCAPNMSQSLVPVVNVANFTVLPSNNYEAVLEHIATVGPLAVNVDASAWSSYEYGVFNGCNQENPDIDHVVQLVGYGTDSKNGDYWLVRNSWNPSWGEEGYIRLARSSGQNCGTDTNPSDGTGCSGGPSSVVVCGTCAILYDTSFPSVVAAK